jgi:hypothetical protein
MEDKRRPAACFVCHRRFDGAKDERVWAIDVSPESNRINYLPLRAHEECLPEPLRDILELDRP